MDIPSLLIDFMPLIVAPILGSFLGALVDRLPRNEGLDGRSYCRNCGKKLGVLELVPILSFLLQGGRCGGCRYPIPKQVLTIEIMMLLAAIPVLFIPSLAEQVIALIIISFLIALAFIDLEHLWLPDALTLPLLIIGLMIAGLEGLDTLTNHAIGVAAGYGLIAALRAFYYWWKDIEAIGLGDAKLLAATGASLGWQALPEVLLVASLTGLLQQMIKPTKHEGAKIAFGANLALGFYCLYIVKAVPSLPPSLLTALF